MTVGEAYAVGGKIGKHANGVLRGDPPFGREARKTFAPIAGGRGRRKGGECGVVQQAAVDVAAAVAVRPFFQSCGAQLPSTSQRKLEVLREK